MKKFQIGQKALIVRDGKIFAVKRSSKADGMNEKWDLPGGRMDWGESIREGLVREVKQEVGLEITDIGRPLSLITFFPHNKKDVQVLRIIYPCKAFGEINFGKEHDEGRWLKIKEALELDFVDDDYNLAIERFIDKGDIEEFINKGMLEESILRRSKLSY